MFYFIKFLEEHNIRYTGGKTTILYVQSKYKVKLQKVVGGYTIQKFSNATGEECSPLIKRKTSSEIIYFMKYLEGK